MGSCQYLSETPQQLIPYDNSSSPGSSGGTSPDANCSLTSSATNTSSSTRRHPNNEDELIITLSKSAIVDYDLPLPPKTQLVEETEDFLPICDALFNVICLVAYFCDIVFDVLAAYAFYADGATEWALLATFFIVTSMVVTQGVSFRWYYRANQNGQSPGSCSTWTLFLLHFSLCGVLWRYFKLFIPVDIRWVKSEVRDLCLLRLIHAFVESGPLLLIQLYGILRKSDPGQVTDLTVVSSALSLFTVCWALGSFSKNVRRQNVHKLVLTWLGVIFQFLWRLGTVSARVTALAVYATVYTYWISLVLILHWFCMLLWLISPRNVFRGEKMSGVKKWGYAALISGVYTFCWINIQEVRSRQRVTIFYVTMFLENALLVGVWLIATAGTGDTPWYQDTVISVVFGAFPVGILFMTLYYNYFHVTKLSYATSGKVKNGPGDVNCCDYYSSVTLEEGRGDRNYVNYPRMAPDAGHGQLSPEGKPGKSFYNKINGHHIHHPNVPGVFNCRFNPAIKRKKKKPTTFVPPPPTADVTPGIHPAASLNFGAQSFHVTRDTTTTPLTSHPRKMTNPFWMKRGQSDRVEGDDGTGSVHRLDIQRKLQEKKLQQLAALKQIEEEIREGKLRSGSPVQVDCCPGDVDQPIPVEKKLPWFRGPGPSGILRPPIILPPSGDELILDPQYLLMPQNPGGLAGFYDRVEWNNFYEPVYPNDEDGIDDLMIGESVSDVMNGGTGYERPRKSKRKKQGQGGESNTRVGESYPYDPHHHHHNSQGSFVVGKGDRSRHKTHKFPSTNSSDDGDVDSGGEDQIYEDVMTYPSIHPPHIPLPTHSGQQLKRFPQRKKKQPETPL